MEEQPYRRTCPDCGGLLSPNVLGHEIAPWRCDICNWAFWVGELTQQARSAYRPFQRDWGALNTESHRLVRLAVAREQQEAYARGCSLRYDQIGLVQERTLRGVLSRGYRLHPEFEAAVRRHTA